MNIYPNSRDHPDLIDAMKNYDYVAKELKSYREKCANPTKVGILRDEPSVVENGLLEKARVASAQIAKLRLKYGLQVGLLR